MGVWNSRTAFRERAHDLFRRPQKMFSGFLLRGSMIIRVAFRNSGRFFVLRADFFDELKLARVSCSDGEAPIKSTARRLTSDSYDFLSIPPHSPHPPVLGTSRLTLSANSFASLASIIESKAGTKFMWQVALKRRT